MDNSTEIKKSMLQFKAVELEQALARASELLAKHSSEQTEEDQNELRETVLTARTKARSIRQELLEKLDQGFGAKPEEITDPNIITSFVARVVEFQERQIKEKGAAVLMAFDYDYFSIMHMSDETRAALADALLGLSIKYKFTPLDVWSELIQNNGKMKGRSDSDVESGT